MNEENNLSRVLSYTYSYGENLVRISLNSRFHGTHREKEAKEGQVKQVEGMWKTTRNNSLVGMSLEDFFFLKEPSREFVEKCLCMVFTLQE